MTILTKFQFDVLDTIERTGFVGGRERVNQPARRAAVNAMRTKGWFTTSQTTTGHHNQLTDVGRALLATERERREKIEARKKRGSVGAWRFR